MTKSALVIEDHTDIAELVELIMAAEGYDVETTPSGLTGLLSFSKRPFDVVLLDMQIDDLSGPGAHRAIRDICPEAAVICMSARSPGWADDAIAQGATACLTKPFDADTLASVVQDIERGERRVVGAPADVRELCPSDLERLATMSPADLDALPFGAIRVDPQGRVTAFNDYEARASGVDSGATIGARFFDIVPCMVVKEFVSCLADGFVRHHLDRVLRFVFPRHGARCVVALRLYYDQGFDQVWIFISAVHGQATEPAWLPSE
jgi:photoactive yellow protein